ncbi:YeeE/YedE thiosulfate transporter family protein [Sulfobacillus thermosulfidooxidans]|uniref:YeeE/YedE thiosulfate transporter family protein n=1 Tax=Sulfobacillus thermosulfidooxidans TaxID=28034 RepID=UPI000415A6D2|nr:YeeE/YedE thiosulfate transporter family protein [Sulfobacillus thermosulfidooxidans]
MIKADAPLWIGIVIGAIIGGFAELWGIANPETLIRLARWKDRLFIGCIAIGSAIGAVVLYGLYASGVDMHFGPKPVYIIGIVLGGLFFGVGMAISGYVPGSEWMALGEGRRDVLYAIPGGILGAAAWTLLYQSAWGQWLVHTLNFGNLIITGSIKHIHPGLTFGISLIYATILLLVAYFLPRYQGGHKSCIRQSFSKTMDPTDQEYRADTLAYLSEGGLSVNTNSWNHEIVARDVPNPNFYSPIMLFVGAVIGVTVVLGIFLHQIFGESTTFSWLAGRLFLPHYAYSTKVFGKIGWEPLSDIGTFFGAFIAALFISRRFNAFRPVIPPSWRNRFGTNPVTRATGAFVGSFLVLFGARMADGCASGHILSGGVQMAVSAWIFTIAVLIAMIITAKWVYGNASEKVNPAHESPSHPQRRVLP